MAQPSPLLRRWREAQQSSDHLWQIVRPPALYDRPVPERHRLVFYLGHLEAFDWNLLAPALDLSPFRPDWDKLFAFGIDPVEGELPSDPPSAWPQVDEIQTYNREIRQRLAGALALPANPELALLIEVALEHRWMHVETLSYLFHNLPYDRKLPGPSPDPGAAARSKPAPIAVPAGAATLGQPRHHGFGWDNEFDAHAVAVPAFAADRYKVTNGDYLAFVQAGAAPPHFWNHDNGGWRYRGMFADVPLPLDHPVYVTQAEAAAYAAWAGKALPTEAQWHRMAYGAPAGPAPNPDRSFPWGEDPPAAAHGNFGLRHWDPLPVQAFSQGASAWGVEGLLGNGWEWTSTPFAPFPGFQPFAFYPGYSANFFDGKHYVLKGASSRTAPCFLRRSFRNWFQPHYPYLYAGFRCVEN